MSKKKTTKFTDNDIVISARPAPNVPQDSVGNMVKVDTVDTKVAEEVTETATPKPTTTIIFASIPVPKRKGRSSKLAYPIGVLTANTEQSFLIPANPKDFKKVGLSVRAFATRKGFKVIVRDEQTESSSGIRVWRKV